MLLVLLLPRLSFGSEEDKQYFEEMQMLAEQGDVVAQFLFRNGEGVPKDDKEAVKWYRLAADRGKAKAQ